MTDRLWSVPDSWMWTEMSEVAQVVGGGTPSTTDKHNFCKPGKGIAWLTPADLSGYNEKTISRGARDITAKGLSASGATLMPSGTVLFSSRAPIGYVAIARGSVCTNQGFKSFVPAPGLDPEFLYYYLHRARQLAENLASGTTFKEISGAKARTIPLPIAPLAEQRRIAERLDDVLSRIEAAVASLERAQAGLKAYRASVLKAAVEGRLVSTEAELARKEGRPHESADTLLARILKERRRRWEEAELARMKTAGKTPNDDRWKTKYHEPTSPDSSKLPALPEGWCWARLDQVSELQLGQQRSPVHAASAVQIPYVRAANITWDGLDLTDVKRMGFPNPVRYRLLHGDVLLSEASGSPMEAGKPAIWRDEIPGACYQKTLIRVRAIDHQALLPEYLRLVFLRDCVTGKFARLAPGVGIVHLTAERMLPWPIPLPPISEQHRIVDEVDRIESIHKSIRASASQEAMRIQRLRQAVLKWAFEGKLADQDASDEPAEKLLARIRAERTATAPAKKTRVRRLKAAS